MELGHWVTGSMGHLGHLLRPGHRVIILTRCVGELGAHTVADMQGQDSHELQSSNAET